MSFEVKDCIKKLHHSGFIVKDLDRSLRFYQDTLKMDLKMRWIETAEQCDVGMCVPGCKLELAQLVGYGAEVELIQFLDEAGTDALLEPNHIGVGHISFEVYDLHGGLSGGGRLQDGQRSYGGAGTEHHLGARTGSGRRAH